MCHTIARSDLDVQVRRPQPEEVEREPVLRELARDAADLRRARARRQRARELARVRRELTEVVARVLERVGDLVRLYGARAVGVEQLEEERAQVRQ